jgi:hypothetical protein
MERNRTEVLFIGRVAENEYLEYADLERYVKGFHPDCQYVGVFQHDLDLALKYISESKTLNVLVVGNLGRGSERHSENRMKHFTHSACRALVKKSLPVHVYLMDTRQSVDYLKELFKWYGLPTVLNTESPIVDVIEMNLEARNAAAKRETTDQKKAESDGKLQEQLAFMDF